MSNQQTNELEQCYTANQLAELHVHVYDQCCIVQLGTLFWKVYRSIDNLQHVFCMLVEIWDQYIEAKGSYFNMKRG